MVLPSVALSRVQFEAVQAADLQQQGQDVGDLSKSEREIGQLEIPAEVEQ